MKSQISQPESWKKVIEIEVPHEELLQKIEEKLGTLKKDVKIPGFRPGKVPPALIKQRYGDAIRQEVIDELVQKSFKDICTENKIKPINVGKVTRLDDNADKPLSFCVETEVDPEIDIKGYDRLKIKVTPKKIKEDDIDEAVKGLLDRFAEFRDVERPAKKGDTVKIEYVKVVIDGVDRSDVRNPNYPVELGSENRIKDFDKGLIGHNAGDTVFIDMKFPEDYSDKDVAGKSGQFTIKIISVQEKSVPDVAAILDKLGEGIKDEQGLRENLRRRMEVEELHKAKSEAQGKAIDQLIRDNPFEVPPSRIEKFIDYMIEEAARERKPGDPQPLRAEVAEKYHDLAVRTIKRHRIIEFISIKERIQATQAEVDAEIQALADMYRQPFEALKASLRKNGTTLRIREDLKDRKTLEFLLDEKA